MGQGGLGRRLLPSVCIYNTLCVRNQWEDMNPTSWAVRVREMMIFSLLGWEKITNVGKELQGLQRRSTTLVQTKICWKMCRLSDIFLQLLDRLPWNLAQTFVSFSESIVIKLRIPFFFLALWCGWILHSDWLLGIHHSDNGHLVCCSSTTVC